jgi:hypothetical protein
MAGLVSSRIGEPGELPTELGLFPDKDRVPGGERYAARNLLGIGPLKGFSCRFEKEGEELTLHLSRYESETEVVKAEEALAGRLGLSTAVIRKSPGAFFDSKYLGRGRVLRSGAYLGIAQGLTGQEEKGSSWEEDLVAEFFKTVTAAGTR